MEPDEDSQFFENVRRSMGAEAVWDFVQAIKTYNTYPNDLEEVNTHLENARIIYDLFLDDDGKFDTAQLDYTTGPCGFATGLPRDIINEIYKLLEELAPQVLTPNLLDMPRKRMIELMEKHSHLKTLRLRKSSKRRRRM